MVLIFLFFGGGVPRGPAAGRRQKKKTCKNKEFSLFVVGPRGAPRGPAGPCAQKTKIRPKSSRFGKNKNSPQKQKIAKIHGNSRHGVHECRFSKSCIFGVCWLSVVIFGLLGFLRFIFPVCIFGFLGFLVFGALNYWQHLRSPNTESGAL